MYRFCLTVWTEIAEGEGPYACAPCVCVECVSSDERCCNRWCVYLYNSREDFNIFGIKLLSVVGGEHIIYMDTSWDTVVPPSCVHTVLARCDPQ
jgi:hypothetical protein